MPASFSPVPGARTTLPAALVALVTTSILTLAATSSGHSQSVREWAAECDENYSECGGSNLPNSCDNTNGMAGEINSSLGNWSRGWYFTGANAWPQDFEDAESAGGLDNPYMDAIGRGDLTVWSGHGTGATSEPNGRWEIAMGHRHAGQCHAGSPDDMKFGEQSNDGFGNNGDNEYVVMDASCSAVEGELRQVWQNWGPGILMRSHQGMGFHDSPDDADDRLEEFVENVGDGDSNRAAWLDAGESCFLWWCHNSPTVITFGENESDAGSRHDNETLRSPRSDPPSGWGGWYRWEYIDNGSC